MARGIDKRRLGKVARTRRAVDGVYDGMHVVSGAAREVSVAWQIARISECIADPKYRPHPVADFWTERLRTLRDCTYAGLSRRELQSLRGMIGRLQHSTAPFAGTPWREDIAYKGPHPRPDWMRNASLLPKRPPGRP